MRGVYPWLYVDYKENLWRFSVNDNRELSYGIMYREGKWTRENIIDVRVTGFGLFLDNSEGIHLVYSNTKGELKYCTLQNKQWVGKILYKVEDDNYEIESIKVEIIGSIMHIFFALSSKDGSDHGVLMHCIWDGHKTNINSIQDIILKSGLKEYYLININYMNEIYLFYLSDEGDELSLNYSIYKNKSWIPSNRLYGIQGDDIYFEVELEKNNIHILNRSKEDYFYLLDHVLIDSLGNFKDFRVYESKKSFIDPLIFSEGNKICSCWIEDNEIYYSIFTGNKWGEPIKYKRENEIKVERYNAYISEIKEGYINERKLYATSGLDIYLYDPKDLLIKNNYKENIIVNRNNKEADSYYSENIEIIKSELYRAKEENRILEDKISHLNILLQKNEQGIDKYQQQLSRIVEQKRKAEENSNIFLELQKKIQGEYEILSKELEELKEEKEKNKNSINECEEEIHLLKEEINSLTKELLIKDRKIQEELDIIRSLEEQNKILEEENLLIKNELSSLIEENKKISTELEVEKNQSVMERLLRRRP
jgi:hypothetical protein